ncbi:hypothetical protein Taro_009921, partial [Colocasia esculenta]|nr:hypothetical protein [Colocasia esculenta]
KNVQNKEAFYQKARSGPPLYAGLPGKANPSTPPLSRRRPLFRIGGRRRRDQPRSVDPPFPSAQLRCSLLTPSPLLRRRSLGSVLSPFGLPVQKDSSSSSSPITTAVRRQKLRSCLLGLPPTSPLSDTDNRGGVGLQASLYKYLNALVIRSDEICDLSGRKNKGVWKKDWGS